MVAKTTKSRKAKAHVAEKELIAMMYGFNLDIPQGDIRFRSSGSSGCDIISSDIALSKIPYAWEVKYQEKLNFWNAWEQAVMHGVHENAKPALAFRKSFKPLLIAMEAKEVMRLIRSDYELKLITEGAARKK